MKKFFAFLLAFLIVVGIYLFMKKQTTPNNEIPVGVKTILGLEQPQKNISNQKKTNEVSQMENNKNLNQNNEGVIKEDTPSTESDTTESTIVVSNEQPTTDNQQPVVIPSQEAVQATGTSVPTENTQEDDGLTPLQRVIKAKNEAK